MDEVADALVDKRTVSDRMWPISHIFARAVCRDEQESRENIGLIRSLAVNDLIEPRSTNQ
jgi:hypothetical protein